MKTSRIPAIGIAPLLVSASVHAQTWDGGGANDSLSTAANWNPDTVPGINGDAIFAGVVRLTPSVTAGFTLNSLTFNNTAGAFVFGGGTLLLSALGLLGWRGRVRGAYASRVSVSASRQNELPDAFDSENVQAFPHAMKVREGGTPSPALGTSALPGTRCGGPFKKRGTQLSTLNIQLP